MVFGWGKKKQKEIPQKSDVPTPQSKEISLSDVPDTVSEIQQLRTSQTLSEIKHLRNNTQPLIDELIKIGNLLSKDDLKIDDIDKHLAIIVVRGKKQVIDVIKKDVTHLPELSSIDDVKKLNSSLNQILKSLNLKTIDAIYHRMIYCNKSIGDTLSVKRIKQSSFIQSTLITKIMLPFTILILFGNVNII